jgi:hypothetical protein
MSNVDEQVIFVECFDSGLRGHSRDNLESGRSDVDARDENARVEIVSREVLSKGSHVFDADVLALEELDPDHSDIRWRWIGIRLGRWRRVSLHHGITWIGRELHSSPAVVSTFCISKRIPSHGPCQTLVATDLPDQTRAIRMSFDEFVEFDLYLLFSQSISPILNHLMNRPPCPPKSCIREVGSLRQLADLVLGVRHLMEPRIGGGPVIPS